MKLGLAHGKWMLKGAASCKNPLPQSRSESDTASSSRSTDEVRLARYLPLDFDSWLAQFGGLILAIYVFINLCFSTLYLPGGRCIAGLVPGSFSDAYG
jgi:hypothetical protein